jgi:hypothetical protein
LEAESPTEISLIFLKGFIGQIKLVAIINTMGMDLVYRWLKKSLTNMAVKLWSRQQYAKAALFLSGYHQKVER